MRSVSNFSIEINDENKNHINYSVFKITENTMDTNEKYRIGNNTSLCIQSADLDEILKFYNSSITDERVRIIITLGKNIFSKAYGIIEDLFGIQIQLMYDDRLK